MTPHNEKIIDKIIDKAVKESLTEYRIAMHCLALSQIKDYFKIMPTAKLKEK